MDDSLSISFVGRQCTSMKDLSNKQMETKYLVEFVILA